MDSLAATSRHRRARRRTSWAGAPPHAAGSLLRGLPPLSLAAAGQPPAENWQRGKPRRCRHEMAAPDLAVPFRGNPSRRLRGGRGAARASRTRTRIRRTGAAPCTHRDASDSPMAGKLPGAASSLTARARGRYGPKGGAGTGAGPAARTQGPIPGQNWEGLGQSACLGGA